MVDTQNDSFDITRCVVDLTKSLTNLTRRVDGVARIELAVATKILTLGGRAIWVEGAKIYEIEKKQFDALISRASSPLARVPLTGRSAAIIRELIASWELMGMLRPLRKWKFLPRGGEFYLLFGAYWDQLSQHIPMFLNGLPGAHIFTFVHDLVPIRYPELTYNPARMRRSFPKYLHSIVSTSQAVLTGSKFTAGELAAYCRQQAWKVPPIKVVPLASDLDLYEPVPVPARPPLTGLRPKQFALMVSTLEPRKNHQFAYDIWNELQSKSSSAILPLVFAGKRGWLNANLVRAIERDARNPNSPILFIESPTDSELAWLYQNAKFTIYPSIMEGWGLPICESLSFGTPCLVSDNSALKEVSQGFAWHGSLDKKDAWLEEVTRCMSNSEYLADRVSDIARKFKKRRWSDFTKDLISSIAPTSSVGQ